jgi:hypothetical protein
VASGDLRVVVVVIGAVGERSGVVAEGARGDEESGAVLAEPAARALDFGGRQRAARMRATTPASKAR